MRDQAWLQAQLDFLLQRNFSDMQRPNMITIAFGRKAQRRLGSIRMTRDKKESRILVNGLFRNPEIPETIVQATIAHELCHYAHGFCSPLSKKYKNPHAGGVIERELRKRDLGLLHDFERQWTKNHWVDLISPLSRRRSKPSAKGLLRLLLG